MSKKVNCWEVKRCGREPGGANVDELGACPAAADARYDRINGGTNGGRVCWAVAGTLCGREIQGTFAQKRVTCFTCKVYHQVQEEEGEQFVLGRRMARQFDASAQAAAKHRP